MFFIWSFDACCSQKPWKGLEIRPLIVKKVTYLSDFFIQTKYLGLKIELNALGKR